MARVAPRLGNAFIRVLLLEGVGKSTIVTSLIKESFVPHVSDGFFANFSSAKLNVLGYS